MGLSPETRGRALGLAGAFLSPAGLGRLYASLMVDRKAFPDGPSLEFFLMCALLVLRVAHDVRVDAERDEAELRGHAALAQGKGSQRPVGYMGSRSICSAELHGALQPKVPRRRGPKYKTDLRDLVVSILLKIYPARSKADTRLAAVAELSGLLWNWGRTPGQGCDLEVIRREMRRRARRVPPASRELDYFRVQYQQRITQSELTTATS